MSLVRREVLAWVFGGGLAGVLGGLASSVAASAQSPKRSAGGRSRDVPPQIIVGKGSDGLPPAVADMRVEILSAVERGEIDELKRAMELNELRPEVGAPAGRDPIEHLRLVSADGKGLSVLLQLGRLLEGRWAAIPGGRDVENNRMYVWPHFAEVPLDALTEEDKAELTALAGQATAEEIAASGKWRGWRLAIGADGVWHTLLDIRP